MGLFSWVLIDERREILEGDLIKVLLPREVVNNMGYQSIEGYYDGYGCIHVYNCKYDLYELLALWNNNNFTVQQVSNKTVTVRETGINIGCYDSEHKKLRFPLRIVLPSSMVTYEELEGYYSCSAIEQGWHSDRIYDDSEVMI